MVMPRPKGGEDRAEHMKEIIESIATLAAEVQRELGRLKLVIEAAEDEECEQRHA